MDQKKILTELFKGVIIIGEDTYNNFIESYKKPKSKFSTATELESQIFALTIIDYSLHSQNLPKSLIEKYVNDGFKILWVNKKTGDYNNKLDLIKSRYQNYANILVKSDANNWQKNLIEELSESLLSTENRKEILADYPLNLDLDLGFLGFIEGKMEFIKTQIGLLYLSNEIVNGVVIGKNCVDITKKKGCYIATMVYGSYDSEQVIVLRKYRDEVLDKTLFGKLFIHIYYFLSPLFVKIFTNNIIVNNLFRVFLNKLVVKFNNKELSNKT